MEKLEILYLIWNLITFSIMGIDKYKAKLGKWRISERFLITMAFAMGALGAVAGSQVFRHKTRKPLFKVMFPLALLFNGVVIAFLKGYISL